MTFSQFHETSPLPHRLSQKRHRSIQFRLQTSCDRAAPFGKRINVGAKILLGALLAFLAIPGAAWAALSVIAPTSTFVNQSVSVTVTSSGCDTTAGSITVAFGDNTSTIVPANTTTTVSRTYTTAGSFTITADGGQALCSPSIATTSITVNTGAISSLTASSPSTVVGQSITFTVAGTGTCPVILDFGDGISTSLSGPFPLTTTHTYSSPASFTAAARASGSNCTGSASTVVTIGTPNIAIVSGNNQTGVINTALPDPFVVRVVGSGNVPLSNVPVTWSTTSGTLSATSTTTDSSGQTSVTLTLGATPGPVTVTASVAGVSVEFNVNNASQVTVTTALQQAAQLGNLAITTATVQSRNISLRLASLRAGQRGLSLKGLSLNAGGQPIPVATLASLLPALGGGGGASADQPPIFNRLGIFVTGQGTFGDQDPRGGEPGFDFHTMGTTLGADYRFTDRLALGTAFGYVSTKADFDASAGDFSANGYSASVFGTYFIQDKMYVDMIATYGWNDYDTTRTITFPGIAEPAKGNPDGDQFALSVSTGYNFHSGGFMFGPTGRVNYIRAHVDEFRETGAGIFNVSVNDQTVRSVAVDLGGRISYAISTPFGVLLPSMHAEWEHELKGGSRLLAGTLVSDPAQTVFSFKTTDPDRNYVNVGSSLTATLQGGSSAFVSYEAVVGRSEFIHHTFNAGIRFEF